jgi:hypothetical protein
VTLHGLGQYPPTPTEQPAPPPPPDAGGPAETGIDALSALLLAGALLLMAVVSFGLRLFSGRGRSAR